MFQKVRYLYSFQDNQFSAVSYPTALAVSDYLNTRGLNERSDVETARKKYGLNRYGEPAGERTHMHTFVYLFA